MSVCQKNPQKQLTPAHILELGCKVFVLDSGKMAVRNGVDDLYNARESEASL